MSIIVNIPSARLLLLQQVKIWFQNRRTKWKKKDNITNAEVAELKQQNKTNGDEKKEEHREDQPALDMSKKTCAKLLSDKLKATKQTATQNFLPKSKKIDKPAELCDSDIESRISITKITNKLSSTDITSDSIKVTVKSFTPEEIKLGDNLSRDVEIRDARAARRRTAANGPTPTADDRRPRCCHRRTTNRLLSYGHIVGYPPARANFLYLRSRLTPEPRAGSRVAGDGRRSGRRRPAA
ncbi:hypothetical protein EVAR_43198_1 [Eumeta japonica]|uniref:Homeobox domain-containing protein n=1 Tax=Eumeta variegata TaxID=151549 RepID=A0A4C1WT75_EUMVA|nr:hypothetical protein EVAR_43198_1 [Eumeta japonica]